jgi:CRISPR type III-B/RAMP module RAMP protein Cmr1
MTMTRKYQPAPTIQHQWHYQEKRTYKFITPMLGGGADVQHADQETGVRVSAIRGMLRFWWRAMYVNAANMSDREAIIWGGTRGNDVTASKVSIHVAQQNLIYKQWDGQSNKYALWLLEWAQGLSWTKFITDVTSDYNTELRLCVKPNFGYADGSIEDQVAYFLYKKGGVLFADLVGNAGLFTHATKVNMNALQPGDVVEIKNAQNANRIGIVQRTLPHDNSILDVVSNGSIKIANIQSAYRFKRNQLTEGQFTLHIQVSDRDAVKDVQSALWAWEHFGGLGARTRRGYGAIELVSHEVFSEQQEKWEPNTIEHPTRDGIQEYFINQMQQRQLDEGTWQYATIATGTPKLFGIGTAYTIGSNSAAVGISNGSNNDSNQVLRDLVSRYNKFRQERHIVPHRPPPRQSKSVWPDANSVRYIHDGFCSRPSPQVNSADDAHIARAQLGLPIMMQFAPSKYRDTAPRISVEINANDTDRFASPLIFRPVRLANNSYVGLILILGNTRVTNDLKVKKGTGNNAAVQNTHAYGSIDVVTADKGQFMANTRDVLAGVLNWMIN